MKKIKDFFNVDQFVIIVLIAIIGGFGAKLTEKYIDETQHTLLQTAVRAIIFVLAIIFIYIIIKIIVGLVKENLKFFRNSIVNKRRDKSVLHSYSKKLEKYEDKISNIRKTCYRNGKLVEKSRISSIHRTIKSISEFLYEVIPEKLDKSFWDDPTIEMLYNFNRERIISLIEECLNNLNDIYEIKPKLKDDSMIEEQLNHVLDNMKLYKK